ncbi:MAG: sodium:calcium antiporter [Firmicutes bacterium]|jgi:cation:H+ antiporter|uniref:Sodium:proton exchanger n=1 Tax=Sulfobacillus benefaciens TaxID=453960 RepID=A0A2T2X6T5_9FIRM|nr:sodium:calcium antiporter [Bacillota bacterium]MCL5013842.1 sodium:calcium antiporter [Bacillota bacterium]PSR30202.1 MAG: sodium:proton exchanger [Sulfobacillus benefaciens]
MPLLLLTASGMVLIVLSADYFTNGVEWVGYYLHLEEGAVGSLLAALGTALPETLVPVMAIIFSPEPGQTAIGLGAILGAPLMLATIGFSVIGLGLGAGKRSTHTLNVPAVGAITKDLGFFLVAFGLAILTTFLPHVIHPVVVAALLIFYVWHAWQLVKGHKTESGGEQALPSQPLRLSSRLRRTAWMAVVQVSLALIGLILGAHFFVNALDMITKVFPISPFILSVIVTPVATELPEVLNSVIWIRRGKDTLAVGNVTGAMAFQSSIVPALGIAFTPWALTPLEIATGALTWLAALWIWTKSRSHRLHVGELLTTGLFYLAYIAIVASLFNS